MLVSNIFSPITHADRKVKTMIIWNVSVDNINSNREVFEAGCAFTVPVQTWTGTAVNRTLEIYPLNILI
jgi:hypothetical protein